jgi:hypothetical protein
MQRLLALGLTVSTAVGGCGSSKTIVDGQCLGDLSSVFTPNDTTILVGQQFTAHVALFACGNQTAANTFIGRLRTARWYWSTSIPAWSQRLGKAVPDSPRRERTERLAVYLLAFDRVVEVRPGLAFVRKRPTFPC